MFCREWLAQLEQHHEAIQAAGLKLVAIGLGEPKHAQRYCPLLSPSATCVLGLGTAAHRAYGLQRGGLGQLAGPHVIAAGLRAAAHGFHQGASTGDVQMLSGTFVVDPAGRVRYAFYSSDAGEHPDLVSLLDELHQEATAS